MTLIEIRIPIVSLMKEDRLLTNLYEFIVALEILYQRTGDTDLISVPTNADPWENGYDDTSAAKLSKVVECLRQMKSFDEDTRSKSPINDPLFTADLLTKLKERKREFKKCFSQYTKIAKKMLEYQIACWSSKAKVHKYSMMTDVAERSVNYYTGDEKEYQTRLANLEKLKKHLSLRKIIDLKNINDYNTGYKQEIAMREELCAHAHEIKHMVLEAIKQRLQKSLDPRTQEDTDMDYTSRCIYNMMTRTYTLVIPPDVDDASPAIQTPDIQPSIYNSMNFKRVVAAAGTQEQFSDDARLEFDNLEDLTDASADSAGSEADEQEAPVSMEKAEAASEKKGFFAALKRRFTKTN